MTDHDRFNPERIAEEICGALRSGTLASEIVQIIQRETSGTGDDLLEQIARIERAVSDRLEREQLTA